MYVDMYRSRCWGNCTLENQQIQVPLTHTYTHMQTGKGFLWVTSAKTVFP